MINPGWLRLGRAAKRLVLWLGLVVSAGGVAPAQTFAVTGGDFANYTIDGQPDPGFTLQRGVTYVFELSNVAFHPFWIKSSLGPGSSGAFNSGVVNNGATSGNLSFTVPTDAPDQLFYQCGNHGSMNGKLTIITPATPPTVRIVHIAVGETIVVTSTGTNGWNVFPEFKCDLAAPDWTPVPAFTNAFNNGTNVTGFDRLESVCGSSTIFLRIRNQRN